MSSPFRKTSPVQTRCKWGVVFFCVALALGGPATLSAQKIEDVLELRGYTRIGDSLEFSVYNKDKERSEWLRVNERREGYEITRYDPEHRIIHIRYNSQSGQLALHGGSIGRHIEPRPATTPDSRPASANTGPQRSENRVQEQGRSASAAADTSRQNLARTAPSNRGGREIATAGGVLMPPASGPNSPQPPAPPSEKENPAAPGNDDDGNEWWKSPGNPPPPPPSSPPAYSPEE